MKYIIYAFMALVMFSCKDVNSEQTKQLEETTESSKLNEFIYDIDGYTYTALGKACKNGNISEVKRLVEQGADIKQGYTDEIYEFDVLYVAIVEGHYDIVEYLVSKGADVNQIYTEDGLTPLSLSIRANQFKITTLLVSHKANVNGEGDLGDDYVTIPLREGLEQKDKETIKLLLKAGARADALNEEEVVGLKELVGDDV
ncbi:ankyrin repeat domain-containing protein [Myroides sp. N17-2]|uniref:ankyrin repeat domain-containing protein n=1 Tax=Myroides sp. N17-2 TaxID=2030799 RepID=UPI000EFD19F1|nr:ankyrin repeat domain-containing protein [Myroides sp. N17-2]